MDRLSSFGESALSLARRLGLVDTARVLQRHGAHLSPSPSPLTWLDVWRAISELNDEKALEVLRRFRAQV